MTEGLHVLLRAGIVRGRREGREQLWQVQPARLEDARGDLDLIARQWDDALERLRRAVEDGA